MKKLKDLILEKLIINKHSKVKQQYSCQPKNWSELREILEERLAKDKNADLNDIDVSHITSMYNKKKYKGIFDGLDPHNIDISKWDVSNVLNMSYMFYNCKNFNCNLSKWNISKVENMSGMFNVCKNFNSDLSKWDVSNVKYMEYMFDGCENFIGYGLEDWDVSNVESMGWMFDGCKSLKNKPSWYKE